MGKLLLALLPSAVMVLAPAPAMAWGFAAHELITRHSIALLPPELKPFYEHFLNVVEIRVTDADRMKAVSGWDDEPNHFVDFGVPEYGKPPFALLPREHGAALQKFGWATLRKYGTLPWREEEMSGALRRAFEGIPRKGAFATSDVTTFTGMAAHYIQDAHQPFHATDNFDGLKTGNDGIHSRFETELFLRFASRLRLKPALPQVIASPRDAAFDALIASHAQLDRILAADDAARRGKEFYDDEYFEKFFAAVQPILEERLSAAITATASVIVTAWEQAGRPVMYTELPRAPQRVRR
ncbi:MAG TPA: hypothetical protein VM032_17965 [Vicinamibacterales bacterium]|nr:hypothetical protein [Vicinamibacterales bacterium]